MFKDPDTGKRVRLPDGIPSIAKLVEESMAKDAFVPFTYAEKPGDSLQIRMLKKIHNIASAVKHRGTRMTAGELRQIHSAAFAAIDGPDPDYDL